MWGPARHDTVWDAIMTHYTCRTSPNTFDAMQLQGHDSAAGRLIRSAIAAQDGSPKAAMFCYFLGVSFDAICWTQQVLRRAGSERGICTSTALSKRVSQ